MREILDLVFGQDFHFNIVVQKRMIFGHLLELALAEAINSRVADVAQIHAISREIHGDDRRPHAFFLRIGECFFVDAQVRVLNRRHQTVFFVLLLPIHLEGPSDLVVFCRILKKL